MAYEKRHGAFIFVLNRLGDNDGERAMQFMKREEKKIIFIHVFMAQLLHSTNNFCITNRTHRTHWLRRHELRAMASKCCPTIWAWHKSFFLCFPLPNGILFAIDSILSVARSFISVSRCQNFGQMRNPMLSNEIARVSAVSKVRTRLQQNLTEYEITYPSQVRHGHDQK